jgi:hypothetical protein
MTRLLLKAFRKLAEEARMCLDERSGTVYGDKSGYSVFINQRGGMKAFCISLSISRQGRMPEYSEMNEIVVSHKKLIVRCDVNRYNVRFDVRLGRSLVGYGRAFRKAMDALDEILPILRGKGFEDSCRICASQDALANYFVDGAPAHLCASCYRDYCASDDERTRIEYEKQETVVGGLVGAFLGSLIGVACIVLIGQIGYVAAASGAVMSVCTLRGYEKLGRKLSTKGIVLTSLLMIVMVYIGQMIDYAITMALAYEIDVLTAFRSIPFMVAGNYIDSVGYYTSLAMLYMFVILGAVPTIINIVKSKKADNRIYRLGARAGFEGEPGDSRF